MVLFVHIHLLLERSKILLNWWSFCNQLRIMGDLRFCVPTLSIKIFNDDLLLTSLCYYKNDIQKFGITG